MRQSGTVPDRWRASALPAGRRQPAGAAGGYQDPLRDHRRRRDPRLVGAGAGLEAGRHPRHHQRGLDQHRASRASTAASAPSCAARTMASCRSWCERCPRTNSSSGWPRRSRAGTGAGRPAPRTGTRRCRAGRHARQAAPPTGSAAAAASTPEIELPCRPRRPGVPPDPVEVHVAMAHSAVDTTMITTASQAGLRRALVLLDQPQGHRHALPAFQLHHVHHRRGHERGDPRRADAAGPAVRQARVLQPDDHRARAGDDLRRRDAGLRRPGQLDDPAADRRAGHGAAAHEQLVVLAPAVRLQPAAARPCSCPAARRPVAGRCTRRCRCRAATTWPSACSPSTWPASVRSWARSTSSPPSSTCARPASTC